MLTLQLNVAKSLPSHLQQDLAKTVRGGNVTLADVVVNEGEAGIGIAAERDTDAIVAPLHQDSI